MARVTFSVDGRVEASVQHLISLGANTSQAVNALIQLGLQQIERGGVLFARLDGQPGVHSPVMVATFHERSKRVVWCRFVVLSRGGGLCAEGYISIEEQEIKLESCTGWIESGVPAEVSRGMMSGAIEARTISGSVDNIAISEDGVVSVEEKPDKYIEYGPYQWTRAVIRKQLQGTLKTA